MIMSAGTGCTISDTAGKLKEEAEKSDRVRPGDVLTEAASGNAGIGLPPGDGPEGLQDDHLLADKMSWERVNTMKWQPTVTLISAVSTLTSQR